ncbi:hypothetical protein BV25DRAFT_1821935 [Artomyces pyxidatus]|uniref:Uncharacterized protein n=1 Tax=Artomyces pyxidatus TaxID=48021 RepID=A0ACB8TBE3_9AGAM|nr:hypothetical protein BV25DRAFT_1821935 [Artomyces pyxidatus]
MSIQDAQSNRYIASLKNSPSKLGTIRAMYGSGASPFCGDPVRQDDKLVWISVYLA